MSDKTQLMLVYRGTWLLERRPVVQPALSPAQMPVKRASVPKKTVCSPKAGRRLGGRALGKRYLYDGEWLLVSEIANRTGLSISTINRRRCGDRIMSTDEVRSMPRKPYAPQYLTFKGETKPVQQWAALRGMNYFTLRKRIKLGWPIERALACPTDRTQRAVNSRIIKRMLAGFSSAPPGYSKTFRTGLGTGAGRRAADFQCKEATGV